MELADEHNERLMLMMPAATFVALRWSSVSSGVFAPTTCRRYSSSTSPRRSSPSPDSLAVDAKLYGRMQGAGRCAAAGKRRAAAEMGEMTGSDGESRKTGAFLPWLPLVFIEGGYSSFLSASFDRSGGKDSHRARTDLFVRFQFFAAKFPPLTHSTSGASR
jgi:hypothetical protein